MRSAVRAVAVAVAVAAISSLSACSSAEPAGSDSKERADDRRSPKAEDAIDLIGNRNADPPLAFEQEAAHTIPMGSMEWPPIAFVGKAAWLVDEAGMTVFDLITGEQITRVEPENPALYKATAPENMTEKNETSSYLTPPQLGRIGDELAVLATIPVELDAESKGQPSRDGVEVIAVRAKDGKVMWRLPVQLYGDLKGQLDASVWRTPFRGMATVQWSTFAATGTFVVDLNEPRMLWQRTDFWVTDTYQDAMVGFRTNSDGTRSVAGVGLASGVDTWAKPMSDDEWAVGSSPDTGRGGGPWTMVEVNSRNGRLTEISTGDTAFTEKDGVRVSGGDRMRCEQGIGGSVVFCASKRGGALALDSDTEQVVWKRPPGAGPKAWNGRMSEVYQDLAYVERGKELAVVDARTGDTVRAGGEVVPDWVTPYAGMTHTDEGIEVYLPR